MFLGNLETDLYPSHPGPKVIISVRFLLFFQYNYIVQLLVPICHSIIPKAMLIPEVLHRQISLLLWADHAVHVTWLKHKWDFAVQT